MKKKACRFLPAIIAFALFACLGNAAGKSSLQNFLIQKKCSDLLSRFAEKPASLEFIECKPGTGQVIFRARYRAAGKDAAIVEKKLHGYYGMTRLVFRCCGWEGRNGKFRAEEKVRVNGALYFFHFRVSMHSDETLIKDRARWAEIPYFYVTAEVLKI